jgi:hypothetical protein
LVLASSLHSGGSRLLAFVSPGPSLKFPAVTLPGSKTAAFSEPTPLHLGEVGDESQYMPQAMMIAFVNKMVEAGGAAGTPSPEYL